MKNLALVLSSLALIGVAYLLFAGSKSEVPQTVVSTDSTGKKVEVALTRIAYVDIDTLHKTCKQFASKKASFESRLKKIEGELKSKSKSIENEYISLQKKAQAGNLSQDQGEKLQKSLLSKQQNLQKLEASLTKKLYKDQDTFNEKFRKDLESAVAKVNKDKKYDYVMLNAEASSYLYSDKRLDVTKQVVDILNASN